MIVKKKMAWARKTKPKKPAEKIIHKTHTNNAYTLNYAIYPKENILNLVI